MTDDFCDPPPSTPPPRRKTKKDRAAARGGGGYYGGYDNSNSNSMRRGGLPPEELNFGSVAPSDPSTGMTDENDANLSLTLARNNAPVCARVAEKAGHRSYSYSVYTCGPRSGPLGARASWDTPVRALRGPTCLASGVGARMLPAEMRSVPV